MAAKLQWRRTRAEENMKRFDKEIEDVLAKRKAWVKRADLFLNGKMVVHTDGKGRMRVVYKERG